MHDQRTSHDEKARNTFVTPVEEDAQMEGVVLALLLHEHPARLTIHELVQEIADEPEEFAERDAIERAVRDLSGVGLVRREGPVVAPTRAALHFDRLDVGCGP